jgi:hypothetical protein
VPSPTLHWSMPHFSHCWMPSSLQAHWGRCCHSCFLWSACLFTVHMRDCPSPPLWWSCPHKSHCYKLSPLQGCWAGATTPVFSCCLIYSSHEGAPSPTLLSSGHPTLFITSFFFSCLFIIQLLGVFFSLFSLGRGQSVQGAMMICPKVYHLFAHLVVSQAG